MQRIWSRTPTRGSVRLYSAVLLTLGAALIHLAVAPSHFREYMPFGVFFLAVGAAQAILAIEIVTRPTRGKSLLMAALSTVLVAVWFVSRTRGLPIGPTPNVPEEVGLADVICNTLEILSTLLFCTLVVWPSRRAMRRVVLLGVASLPTALLTVATTAVAVAATLSEMPAAVNVAPPQPGTTSVTALVDQIDPARPVDRFTLTAEQISLDGQTIYAYNGTVPGPELRVTQGDQVEVTLVNHLPESTTLHWHGLVVPNAADGVAGVTQDAVKPGDAYTYTFVAREAGTYWYHSHQQTEAQLPRGLFGALVVLPVDGVAETRDTTVVLHGTAGHVHASLPSFDANPGDTVRVRVVNAVVPGMDGGPEAPMLVGAEARVVALDGRDLNEPQLLGPTRIPLGMGQRADLLFTMPPSGAVQLVDNELTGETTVVQHFFETPADPLPAVIFGSGSVTAAPDDAPLFDYTTYGAPSADPIAARTPDVQAPLILDEHGGFRDGRPQLIHTINAAASPSVPPITVREGDVVRLQIVNNTDEYHPMHLHGHVMSVISRNGVAVTGTPVHLDTLLVGPRETYTVAFLADNPGIWMLHCHVLLHAGMGMMATLNYAGVSTPFEMGATSGNVPE